MLRSVTFHSAVLVLLGCLTPKFASPFVPCRLRQSRIERSTGRRSHAGSNSASPPCFGDLVEDSRRPVEQGGPTDLEKRGQNESMGGSRCAYRSPLAAPIQLRQLPRGGPGLSVVNSGTGASCINPTSYDFASSVPSRSATKPLKGANSAAQRARSSRGSSPSTNAPGPLSAKMQPDWHCSKAKSVRPPGPSQARAEIVRMTANFGTPLISPATAAAVFADVCL